MAFLGFRRPEPAGNAHALLQDSRDVIVLVSTDGTVLYVTPSVRDLIGVDPDDVIGGRVDDWLPFAPSGETRFRHSDGTDHWVESTTRDLADQGVVTHLRDVTDQRAAAERLAFATNYDALTGLLNRAAFLACDNVPAAVLIVDLDDLKALNDTLGHGAGDAAIIAAGGMLRRSAEGLDPVIGRLDGDEFGLLLPGVDTVDRAVAVAERLLMELEKPISYAGHTFRIRASIGIAVTDAAYPDAAYPDVVRRADAAMRRAKRQGTHSYELHEAEVPAWR